MPRQYLSKFEMSAVTSRNTHLFIYRPY